jgi:tetratricopeptide (TPR) repeat protein
MTQPGLAGGGRTLLIAGGALGVIGIIALGIVFLRPREKPTPSPEAGAGVEAVTRQLVLTKVQLARTKVEVKDYTGAAVEARQVLELDPGNAEAKAILAQVDSTMKELDAAANEAREAVKAGNTEKASAALSRVIAIDPQHPVAAELSSQLNSRFQGQADEARQAMKKARAAAEQAKAGSQQAFTEGVSLAREADALSQQSEFTGAAQKYASARNHFESARRAAQERVTGQPTSTLVAASRPSAGASAPPAGASPGATTSVAPVTPPTAAPASIAADEAAVRHVIAEYEKAIEQKDVALFKRIKPNLTHGEEGPLKDGFKLQPKGYDVRITIESVQFNGSEATVRLSRRDMVKSKAMDPTQQTIVLVKSADGWTIRNIGQ